MKMTNGLMRSVRGRLAKLELSSLRRWMRGNAPLVTRRGQAAISRALEPMEGRILFTGFNVTSATPAGGTYLPSIPSTMDLDFNANVRLSSAQAGDLTVDGVPATSLTIVNNRKLRFTLPALAEGERTFLLPAGALRSLQNAPVGQFTGVFTIDLTAPSISSISLTPGQVVDEGPLSLSVTFTESMKVSGIDTNIVSLVSDGGATVTPTSAVYDESTKTLAVEFPQLAGESGYTLQLISGNGKLEDLAGNDLDGDNDGTLGGNYSVSFGVNAPQSPLPGVFERVAPAGSTVYRSEFSGTINFNNDSDSHSLVLDGGQTLSLLVTPAAGLTATVEIYDNAGTLLTSATSTSAGLTATVQSFAIPTTGTYQIVIKGATAETGTYTVRSYLNAGVESESEGDGDNDSTSSAQDLDPILQSIGNGADRGALLGSIPDSTTTATYTRTINQNQYFHPWWGGNTDVYFNFNDVSGFVPSGDASLRMFGSASWVSGHWSGNYQYFNESGTGLHGNNWSGSTSWDTTTTFSPAQIQSWASDGNIQARFYGWNSSASPSATLSYPYSQTTIGSNDFYKLSLQDGQSVSVALKTLTGSGLSFELLDPNGVKLADSVTTDDAENAVANIAAAQTGTYYIHIKRGDSSQPTYNLVVSKNASIDLGTNDSAATAQDITVNGRALGAITPGTDEADFYAFSTTAGDVLNITTAAPGSGVGEFVNTLDMTLELYDASGQLVASASGATQLNETLSHTVSTGGNYTLKVSAENGTGGEYDVTVAGYTKTLPAFDVSASTVVDGSRINTIPTTVTIDLNSPFLPGTESAADLTVNGVGATSVQVVDSNTLTYTLPTLTDGVQTVTINADAMRNLQGASLGAYGATFTIDTSGPRVSSVTPATGGTVSTRDVTYTVTFNEDIVAANIDPSDFSLQSFSEVVGTFDQSINNTYAFYGNVPYNFSVPAGTQISGPGTISVSGTWRANWANPSLIYFYNEDGGNTFSDSANTWWGTRSVNTSWSVSQAQLQTWATDGTISPYITHSGTFSDGLSMRVTFPTLTTTIKNTYEPTTYSYNESTRTLTLNYVDLAEDQYKLTVKSGDGKFEDVLGNDLDGDTNNVNGGDAVQTFTVEYDRNALPVPLTPVGPLGSLSYESSSVLANIGTTSDFDTYTVTVDAGQRLSVVVLPTSGSGLQPSVNIFRTYNPTTGVYSNSAGSGTATSAGTGAVAAVTTLPTAATTTYHVRVSSVNGSGTTGGYTLQALTNTVFERERLNPSLSNDTRGSETTGQTSTAQILDARFTTLGGSSSSGIANVLGQIPVSGSEDNYSVTNLQPGESLAVSLKQLEGSGAILEIYDANNVRVTTGITTSTNVDRIVTSLVSTNGGTYYVRVAADSSGTTDLKYALQVLKNAAFDTGANDALESATDISTTGNLDGTARVLGHASPTDTDYYKLDAMLGDPIVIGISTPASGTGEFVNGLVPMVEVLDSTGTVVSGATYTGAGSGIISFTAPADGTYYLRVSSSADTSGEYALAVAGYTLTPPALTVTNFSIAQGAFLNSVPETIDVSFSGSLDLASIDATDLTVGGAAATGFSIVDGDTVRFTLPALSQGEHTVELTGASMTALNGVDVTGATRSFTIDLTAPQVTSTSVAGGSLLSAGPLSLAITFNEPIKDGTSLDASDLLLVGSVSGSITPDSVSYDNATRILTLGFNDLTGDQTFVLNLTSGVGRFEDRAGNALDGNANGTAGDNFVLNFGVNAPSIALPAFTQIAPAGSLVYQTSQTGVIDFAGDTDEFTVTLDAGQTLAVVLTPTGGLIGKVDIVSANGTVLAGATSSAANIVAFVQSTTITNAGTYTLRFSGASGTTGSYAAGIYLNAAVEAENHGGAANDSMLTAQNLDGAFQAAGQGASQASVLGGMPRPIAIGTYTRTINLGQYFDPATGNGTRNVTFNFDDVAGYTPTGPATVNMYGSASWARSWYTNSISSYFDEGGTQLYGYPWNYWQSSWSWNTTSSISQSQLESYKSDGNVSFRFDGYNASSSPSINLSFPYLTTVESTTDYYAFNLSEGEIASVAFKQLTGGGVTLALFDSNNVKIVDGASPSAELDSAISNFVAPATGTYYLKVTPTDQSAPTYSLVVSKNSEFDTGANDDVSTAQDITLTGRATGAITSGDTDFYTVQAKAGDVLTISTSTFASDTGEFVNTLDTTLELFDATGASLATASGTAGNETITFTVDTDGQYVIQVNAENNTTGEYVVNVSGATGAAPAFLVAGASIVNGAQLSVRPTTITIDLNHAVNPGTINALDLTVGGVAATSVTQVDADTLEFTLPTLIDGDYTVELAAGALKDLQGTDLSAYSLSFHLDTSGPLVVSTSIAQDGTVGTRNITYTVTFDEDLNEANIDPSDFTLQAFEQVTGTYTRTINLSQYFDPWSGGTPDVYFNFNDVSGFAPSGNASLQMFGSAGWTRSWSTANYQYFDESGTNLHGNSWNWSTSWNTTATFSLAQLQTWASDGNVQARFYGWNSSASPSATLSFPYQTTTLKNTFTPAVYSYDASTKTLTLEYTDLPEDQYKLTLKSGDGQFEDVLGTNLDGDANNTPGGDYVGRFSVEYTSNPLLTSFDPLSPAGSLIHQGNGSANAASGSDTDDFTLLLDAGQTVTIITTPTSGLQPTLQVLDANGNSLGSASATQQGGKIVLQTAAVTTDGQYTLRFGSAAGSGNYSFKVYLNTALESESNGGASNNSIADAQDLDASFVTLGGDSSRGAVLGGITYSQVTSTYSQSINQGTPGYNVNSIYNFNVPAGVQPSGAGTISVSGNWGYNWTYPAYIYYYDENGTNRYGQLTYNGHWSPTNGSTSWTVSQSDLQTFASNGVVSPYIFWNGGLTQSGMTMSLSFPYQTTVVGSDDYYKLSLTPGQTVELALKLTSGEGVSIDVFDAFSNPITTGTPTGNDQTDAVTQSFRSVNGGTYYVRVKSGGTSALQYALVATKSASFDAGNNDSPAAAQDLTLTGTALGYLSPTDTDFFKFDAITGNQVVISTLAPAAGAGQFNNTLDTVIDIVDINGDVVQSSSGTTGLNESLTFDVPADGTYYVRVSSENGTAGEYTLSLTGATPTFPALSVSEFSIEDNSSTNVAPTTVTVSFNRTVNLSSVLAAALVVNGQPATNVTLVDADTVLFTLPALTEGVQTIELTTGEIVDLNGTALTGFTRTFTFETVPPKVNATSIQSGEQVTTPDFTLAVTFDEVLRGADLDPADFVLNGNLGSAINPTTVVYDASTLTATLSFLTVPEDDYTFRAFAGAIADLAGNALDGDGNGSGGDDYTLSFTVDHTTANLPTLIRLAPAGAQVYAASVNARMPAGDLGDDYTVHLDANQLLTISVLPTSGDLQPTIEVLDPSGIPIGYIMSNGQGTGVVLQGVLASEAGVYTIRIIPASGSGNYALAAHLNAAVEEEPVVSVDNSNTSVAQNLDTAVTDFRAVVVGSISGGDVDVFVTSQDPGQSLRLTLALPAGSDATLEVLDGSGNLLAEGVLSADGTRRSLSIVTPASGEHFIRITGLYGDGRYTLVTQNDGTFDTGSNDDTSTAIDLNDVVGNLSGPGSARALGFIEAGSGDLDLYKFTAVEGNTIDLLLASPAGGSGAFDNTFDGILELLDASGNVIATSSGNAGDQTISHVVDAGTGGTFFVRISAENSTGGEYALSLSGVTKTEPTFAVAGISFNGQPATSETRLTYVPSQMTITFDNDVFLNTIDASDLTFNGQPAASSVTRTGANTLTFDLYAQPDGVYNVELAAGSLTSRHNLLLPAFMSTLTIDQVGPTITGTNITEGLALPAGDVTWTVTLSEAIRAQNLTGDDFLLVDSQGNSYSPASIDYTEGATTLSVTFSALPGEQTYTLTARAGDDAIEDLAGNDFDGDNNASIGGDHVVTFGLNDTPQALPTDFTPVNPLGSTVYSKSITSAIDFTGDDESFTLTLEAGQTLSVVMTPGAGLQARIQVIDLNGNSATDIDTTATGRTAVVQALGTMAGQYTIRFTGMNNSTGSFTATVTLNAAVETEHAGGQDNSSFGNAQNLDQAFRTLETGGQIATVVGSIPDATSTATYSRSINQYVSTNYGANANFDFNDVGGYTPTGPATINFSGSSSWYWSWWTQSQTIFYNNETGSQLYSYPWSYWQSSWSYNSGNVQVDQGTFQSMTTDGNAQFRYYGFNQSGTATATLSFPYSTTVDGNDDYYSFNLDAGQSATVALKQLTGSGTTVELYDSAGTKISTGVSISQTVDGLVADFVSVTGGTYYVKVDNDGSSEPTYSVTVTKGLSFDAGANDASGEAKDITASGAAVGYTASGDDDFFQFSASVNDTITLTLRSPSMGADGLANTLDASMELFDEAGNSLATGTVSSGITHPVTQTGRYVVKVSSVTGAGEYSIGVAGNTRTLAPFVVESISIEDGVALTTVPTQVTITFSQPFVPGTESASDLLVDDVAATSVTVIDSRTLRFMLPALTDGGHVISFATGALTNLQGTGLSEFFSNFHLDTTGPIVTSTSAANGATIDADDLTYTITFDEDMDASAINPSDFALVSFEQTSGTYTRTINLGQYFDPWWGGTPDVYFNFNDVSGFVPSGDASLQMSGSASWARSWNNSNYRYHDENGTQLTGSSFWGSTNWNTTATFSLAQLQTWASDGNVQARFYGWNTSASPSATLSFPYTQTTVKQTYEPASYIYDEGTRTLTLQYNSLPEDFYRLTLNSGAGQFQDFLGNALDGDANGTLGGNFVSTFYINNAPKTFPATTITGIAGTQVYQTATSGTLDYAADKDSWTIYLDAGQTISVLATGGAGVTPVLDVLDPADANIGTITAGSAGATVLLQNITATSAGTYTVRIADTGSAKGTYAIKLFLNTALESENNGGVANSSIGTAQSLDNTFTTTAGSNARAAVLGGISYSRITDTYSQSMSQSQYFDPWSNSGNPNVFFNFNNIAGNTPSGDVTLRMNGSSGWTRGWDSAQHYYYGEDNTSLYDFRWNGGYSWDTTRTITPAQWTSWSSDGNFQVRYNGYNTNGSPSATLSYPYTNITIGSDDYYSFSATAGETLSLAVKLASGSGVELSLFDAAGTKIASGASSGELDQALSNYVVPTTGTYYARVKLTGTTALTYDLSVAKDAVVDNGSNTAPSTAQNINAAGGAIGLLNGTDSDHYFFYATAGDNVTLMLATPGSDTGDFVNTLDGSLEIYDESGTLLASSGGASTFSYLAATTGKVIVKVSSDTSTTGEYSLDVSGYTKVTSPLTVTSSSLTTGSYLPTAPTEVIVTFSDTIDLSSISASDLTINGAEAISFSIIDGQSVKFFLPNLTDGEQTIALASGAVTALDGAGLSEFTQVFTLDRVAPIISSTSVEQNGVVPQGPLTVNVVFDEPLFDNGAGIGVEDVTLTGSVQGVVSATAATYDPSNYTLTLTFPTLDAKQTFVLTLANGAFVDRGQIALDGNSNGTAGDDFSLNFAVRAPAVAFPTPLSVINPLGGLVYTGEAAGNLSFTLDSDDYDLALDAGQTVTLVMNPAAGMTGKVSLVDYTGAVVASTTGTGNGKTVVLQTTLITQGIYTLRFASTNGTGAYAGKLYLNAAVETESRVGTDNSSFTNAQDLDGAFATLPGGTGSRAVVLGSIDPTITTAMYDQTINNTHAYYSNVFYNFNVLTGTQITGPGTIQINGTWFANWNNPSYLYAYNEGGGNTFGQISYTWWGTQSTNTSWGVSQSQLQNWATDGTISPYFYHQGTASNGLSMRLTFPYSATAAGNDDFYKVTLTENEVASVSITGLSGTSPSIELYDANFDLVTLGEFKGTNVNEAVADFVAPASGVYYIKVKSAGDTATHDYSVVVTKGASFDVGANDTTETAQDITLTKTALGHLGDAGDSVDVYTLQVGDTLLGGGATDPLRLNLQTLTPGGGTGQFVNTLDAKIELYDSNGTLVSSNDNGANDRRNAKLGYNVLTPGTYTVHVTNVNGSAGEYVLDAKVVPLTAGVTITPTDGLITTEAAGTDSFTVVLNTQPTADVTVTLSSSNLLEGTIDLTELVFTTDNWNVARTVTVTGVNDDSVDRDQSFTITSVITSSDANYNGLVTESVGVVNQDDDAAGITVTPTDGLEVNETGTTATFNVVLASKPTAIVTVNLLSGNLGEAITDVTELLFTPENWNIMQTVTVTGVNEDSIDGAQTVTISTTATSTDADYAQVDPADVTVTNYDDDVAGINITDTTGMVTTEAGGAASFALWLTSRPSAPVTIYLTSDNDSEGMPGVSEVVFTPEDWNQQHWVNVVGMNDDIDDGDTTFAVNMSAAVSDDPNYAGMSMGTSFVSITNTNDDTAGVIVTPTTLSSTEAGGAAGFAVSLASKPMADVVVTLGGDETEGSITVVTLTFTPDDWNVAQTVDVVGVDDFVDDGDITYDLTLTVSSPDAKYQGMAVGPVSITNTDNDTAGVSVTPTTGLVTSETGDSTNFAVVLTSKPEQDVTITLAGDATEGSFNVSTLTFTPGNWDQPQLVTITGVDDTLGDGDVTYNVALTVGSTDVKYNGLSVAPVSVTNTGDEALDATGPKVTKVIVGSTAWSASFRSKLDPSGLGYAITDGNGSNQLRGLPWTNINRVSVVFDEAVNVSIADLALVGVNTPSYGISAFTYNAATFTATWTLGSNLMRDKFFLGVNDVITDTSGNTLDGEWFNPTALNTTVSDTFPSGNGSTGGDFLFRFNVVPGDVDGNTRVLSADTTFLRGRLGVGSNGATYSVFADLNGSGIIDSTDLSLINARLGQQLPLANPVAPIF